MGYPEKCPLEKSPRKNTRVRVRIRVRVRVRVRVKSGGLFSRGAFFLEPQMDKCEKTVKLTLIDLAHIGGLLRHKLKK